MTSRSPDATRPMVLNRGIHLKYVTPEARDDHKVATYLSGGDDVTIKVHMDRLVSWNLADSAAGKALSASRWSRQLDG